MNFFGTALVISIFLVTVHCRTVKKIDANHFYVKYTPEENRGKDWWQTATFYQIYPRSFKDSNNDGIGDLQGIISKLDHLVDAGVTATWLSPIFKSPQIDQGYDISDYRDIDPDYGTLDDLKELLNKAHALNIKIILDYVPNHTSDMHEWFQNSVNNVTGFEDFYIWKDGKINENGTRVPPNNWISSFKGTAWSWNEKRQQYYLHQFAPAQPDLNYRNPAVVQEMKDVLTYWMDFGVDGFRIDALPELFEDDRFLDEPKSGLPGYTPDDPEYLVQMYTKNQNETYEMTYQWREHVDNYKLEHNTDSKVLMTEAYTSFEDRLHYYGSDDGRLGAHFSFNFDFIKLLSNTSTAEDIDNIIWEWMTKLPTKYTYNWVLGNHDQRRVASRLGVENIDGLNMLVSVLPGVQVTYNGEEIGQENGEVTCEEGQDPSAIKNCSTFDEVSRDFQRTPFQWDNSTNAGFNEGAKPWLPVSKNANVTNLANQNVQGVVTHYNIYKQTLSLRKEINNLTEMVWGVSLLNKNTVIESFRQFLTGAPDDELRIVTYLFNYSDEVQTLEEHGALDLHTVIIVSENSPHNIGDVLNGTIVLQPHEAIICSRVCSGC